jgi:seryl-tRNA synthetase
MNSRFSGGAGKVKADPHDKYIFNEFEREIPKLVDTAKPTDNIEALVQALRQPTKDTSVDDALARLEAKERELDETLSEARAEKERISQAYRDRFKKKEVTETVAA